MLLPKLSPKAVAVLVLVLAATGLLVYGLFSYDLFSYDISQGLSWTWPAERISTRAVQAFILEAGPYGWLASMGLMVLHSFVPLPSELIAITNGMVYGVFWGTVVTWSGAMLGAFAAFGISRKVGHGPVQRYLARKNLQKYQKLLNSYGPGFFLVCRLIPVISFNLINYAAGLTGMTWWTFTWTTGVGIVPMTVLMVTMGSKIHSLSAWAWLGVLLLALALWVLMHFLYKKYFKIREVNL